MFRQVISFFVFYLKIYQIATNLFSVERKRMVYDKQKNHVEHTQNILTMRLNILWTYDILIGLAQIFCDVLIKVRPAESLSSICQPWFCKTD